MIAFVVASLVVGSSPTGKSVEIAPGVTMPSISLGKFWCERGWEGL